MPDDGAPTIRPTLFEKVGDAFPFPRQTKKNDETGTFAGELRGYYPIMGPGEWNPAKSKLGTPPGRKKPHLGVDIYAGHFPYPLETSVHAMIAGWAESVFDNEKPDGNGNRLWLYPDKKKKNEKYVFAHLNRFGGRFRGRGLVEVKLDDVVGYAGCTGNADSDDYKECSGTTSPLNVTSCHVHLQWVGPTAKSPLELLGWTLRFATDAKQTPDEFEEAGRMLDAVPTKDFATGRLVKTSNAAGRPSKTDKASRLAEPHHLIDLDDDVAIRITKEAYEAASKRLSNAKETAEVGDGIDTCREELGKLRGLPDRLEALKDAVAAATDPRALCRDVMRFLLEAYRAMWVVLGGPALLKVGRKGSGPPECGLGLRGRSFAIGGANWQACLHLTTLQDVRPVDAGPGKPPKSEAFLRPDPTLSVTFGAGTEWHAILDGAILNDLPQDGAAATLLAASWHFALTIISVHSVAWRYANGLNRDPAGPEGKPARVLVVALMDDAIQAAKDVAAAVDPLASSSPRGEVKAMLAALAQGGVAASEVARKALDPKIKTLQRVTPLVHMLALDGNTSTT